MREQIERDARSIPYYANPVKIAVSAMERQDAIAWNRCLDEVIKIIAARQDESFDDYGYKELESLKQELEKLRR